MGIAQTIKDVLVTEVMVEVPPSEIDENGSLRTMFGLDSLGFVELRVQCEERFGVTISDSDFTPENFSSVASVAALVERLVAAGDHAGDHVAGKA